jgi:hypothetical protein
MQAIKFIGKILYSTQWGQIYGAPKWFWTMHFPYIIKCLFQTLYVRPHYKNYFYNTRVYDGRTKNDFKKGHLLQFLYKLGCIKRYNSDDPCDDGRSYFIGHLDDE